MRFMIIRKADADTEAGKMPSEELLAAMGAYNEKMAEAGVLVSGEGLAPSTTGARVEFSGGKPSVTDGPFTETKELIAGFTMIEVDSLDDALAWAKQWPALDGGGQARLEIRRVFTADDFGDEFTPELREREEQLREELGE